MCDGSEAMSGFFCIHGRGRGSLVDCCFLGLCVCSKGVGEMACLLRGGGVSRAW